MQLSTSCGYFAADFQLEDHLSVLRLTPLTQSARDWIDAHVAYEDWQMFGHGIVIEPRYAGAILEGLVADGLTVRL
jgi:hypothetical protein